MVQYEEIGCFIGKTLISAVRDTGKYDSDDHIIFEFSDGSKYKMHHYQSCCENVSIEDIDGELSDIVGLPLTTAEYAYKEDEADYGDETWTFYRIGTEKAMIVIRWFGSSNGYYSTTAEIDEIK